MVEGASNEIEPAPAFTIDDLASSSKVPSRTIRFYQSKGLLPKPAIVGRVAFYDKTHLQRLELIASLQDRGLRIEAIRDLVTRMDRGELDIGEWLGLDAQLKRPWNEDQARTVTEEELYDLAGERRVGLLKDLLRAGLVERRDNTLFVPSPAVLGIFAKLMAKGFDLDDVAKAKGILERHLGRAAKELTALATDRAKGAETDFATVVDELRPLVMEGVRVLFAQAMQRELHQLATSGRAPRPARRAR